MIRFLLCCLLAFLRYSEVMQWVSSFGASTQSATSKVRFAGLREHFRDLQQEKARLLQCKQTGQNMQIRSSNATMSRDESMALLKYSIKYLAVLGLHTAFSLTMLYVTTRLFGCCNFRAPLVALPLVLLFSLTSTRVFL
jgi:hypothetical protein